ncbi:PilW family protein [Alkaliphilus oremlandii]|uniref:Prepilin-type N-terminal cleavage/methylation domain-containing protein n=1 Tax=Alkaliphilus oremlandii (strain OhILAs) TaxID=350688 RepID=A8MLZ9_ALKOO|nr:prepilin-type N-terminal cleavage/methylation domain-containing protein [Alkaliphilus oremlandii]ABW18166.1 hypothetical protein Clos_0606 [Alkaliphilus oremlandii OhILAs]
MKSNRGFTLIELAIVLGLAGIVLSMIFSPIIFSFQNFGIQNEKANITSNLRATMDHLTRQIRKASEVEVVNDNAIKIDSKVYKIQDRNLVKDDSILIEGVDELIIRKDKNRMEIKVVIRDRKNKEHSLSSTINMR